MPAGGCGLCTSPKVVTAAITASPTLPVGIYTAQIVMYSQFGTYSMTVPVTLTVGSTLNMQAGDSIMVNDGPNQERATIQSRVMPERRWRG